MLCVSGLIGLRLRIVGGVGFVVRESGAASSSDAAAKQPRKTSSTRPRS